MGALIDVVFPVFAIVGLGFLAGRFGVLGEDSAAALNRFVYYFALPPVLFVYPARQSIGDVLNGPFIAAFLGGALATIVLAAVANRLWLKHDMAAFAVHGLNVGFPNTSYMGVPLFLTAFGTDGAMPAIVATLVGIGLLVGGAIGVIETARARGPSRTQAARRAAVVLLRNPLLIAIGLGILASLVALPIPKPVGNFLDLMASCAGPAALFALGLSLVGRKLFGDALELSWMLALKLLAQPAITFLLVTYVFEMERDWAVGAVLLAGLPVGAVAFVVAQQYDVYVRRTSSAILLSTLLSLFTISGLLVFFDVT